jgi:hypothetical protein
MGVATWVSASSFGQKPRLPSDQCYAATDVAHRLRQLQPDVPKTIRCSASGRAPRYASSAWPPEVHVCPVSRAWVPTFTNTRSAVSVRSPPSRKSDLESARSCESSIPANQFSSQNTRRAQLHTCARDDSITRSTRNLLKIFGAVFADAVNEMNQKFLHAELCFIESRGDNLAATFSPELADLTIYVIDVAAGGADDGSEGTGASAALQVPDGSGPSNGSGS